MKYQYLKTAIKLILTNWEREPWKNVKQVTYPTALYWDTEQISKANKKFKNLTIKFIRTENPVFPNQIIVTKND